MLGFFDRESREAVCGGAEDVNPAVRMAPLGKWMGMNRKRAEGAACAFLNSYFAFGTFVGI